MLFMVGLRKEVENHSSAMIYGSESAMNALEDPQPLRAPESKEMFAEINHFYEPWY